MLQKCKFCVPVLSTSTIKRIVSTLLVLLFIDICFLLYMIPWRASPHIIAKINSAPPSLQERRSAFYKDPVPAVHTNLTYANSILSLVNLQEYISQRRKPVCERSILNETNSRIIAGCRRSVVLIKTHKTGSTTLQNILLRYGLFNEYHFAVPLYRASFLWPQKFVKLSVAYSDKRPDEKFDMLVHHARMNQPIMNEIMNGDPFYLTILRDPISLFFSAYSYYNYERYCYHKPITEFVHSESYNQSLHGPCKSYGLPTRNLLSFDLGLQYSEMDDPAAVEEFITYLDSSMNLVLLMEHYDESMLLLKKFLGLTFEDILYFRQNSQRPNFSPFVRQDKTLLQQIKRFNNADMLLYDHFKKKFEILLAQHFGPGELAHDLQIFQSKKTAKGKKCINRQADRRTLFLTNNKIFIPYGGALGYLLNDEYKDDIECRTMALPEIQFTRFLQTYR